jgi:hypothetical protein
LQAHAIDREFAPRQVHIAQASGRQILRQRFFAIEQAGPQPRVGTHRQRALVTFRRDDQGQLPPFGRIRDMLLLIRGRTARTVRQKPDLEEMGLRLAFVVELTVTHAGSRAHALHIARAQHP